jgi:prolyl oligopeptidase PreP (S9A serine peptidase family)
MRLNCTINGLLLSVLIKKKNTFTDFIACAEHLISERYTDEERLFALGRGAGGLLIGAVVNMRPDLFKGLLPQSLSLILLLQCWMRAFF